MLPAPDNRLFSLEDVVLPTPLVKLTRDHLETNDRELWAKCYPRIYENLPGGYASPKMPAWELSGIAEKVRMGWRGQSEMVELGWGSKLIEKRVPMYWVARDLCEAVEQTVPPVEFSWQTEHLPFEAAVFMVPKGAVKHGKETEGSATFVSYARLRTECEVINYVYPKTVIIPRPGSFIIIAHTERGCLQHWNFPATSWPILKLAELDEKIQHSPYVSHTSGVPGFENFTMTDEDNRFMAKTTHLVFGLLVLMVRRPDLVEKGQELKRVPSKAGPAREFWSPNVIGKNYRVKRLYIPQGGTHASPRGHWVRGFYRDQHFGPKAANQVKEIWLEPYFRGGVLEDKRKNSGRAAT